MLSVVPQPGITPLVKRPLVIVDDSEYDDDKNDDKDGNGAADGPLADVEDITDDDDDFKTPTNTPPRESADKGKPKTAAAARKARKNVWQRVKRAEARAAALATANLTTNNSSCAKKEGPSSSL